MDKPTLNLLDFNRVKIGEAQPVSLAHAFTSNPDRAEELVELLNAAIQAALDQAASTAATRLAEASALTTAVAANTKAEHDAAVAALQASVSDKTDKLAEANLANTRLVSEINGLRSQLNAAQQQKTQLEVEHREAVSAEQAKARDAEVKAKVLELKITSLPKNPTAEHLADLKKASEQSEEERKAELIGKRRAADQKRLDDLQAKQAARAQETAQK